MAYKPASYALRRCIVILALCLFFLVPTLNAGTSSSQVEVIRLAGGDWGYPSPYAHYPREPGGFKMCMIFDSLLERGDQGLIPWLPLAFDLLCAGDEVRMAQILKQRLADVGVQISIKSCNGKTRDSRVRNQNYDLAIIGQGGWGGDPDYLIAHCTRDIKQSSSPSASGGSGLASPALMKLLNAQRSQTDPQKRRDLVVKIQQMAAQEVPEIPLFYTTGYTAFRPAKYDGWMFMFDHHSLEHSKLSYLDWKTWR